MNANELANLLEVDSWYKLVTREEIATMLRQQQAEIESLKANFNKENSVKEVFNTEPVAWMEIDEGGITEYKVWREPVSKQSIPLYTHPVDAINISQEYVDKTQKNRHDLTDEEIMDIKTLMEINYGCVPPLEFAKAILRKAQEK